MYFNPLAIPLIGASLVMIAVAYLAWNFRASRGARNFALLALACAVYAIAYAMEISSSSLEAIMFWVKVEYFGIAFIPTFFILFSLSYTERINSVPKAVLTALYIISLVTIALVQTSDYHDLFYRSVGLNTAGSFPVLEFTRGPWYWVQGVYAVVGVLFANILFMQMWLSTNKVYRGQITTMVAGSFIPWIGLLVYLALPVSWKIDIVPFLLSISGIIFFIGLVRFGLFDLVPIAQTRFFEEMPDGALILDAGMRIADFNSAAAQYLELDHKAVGGSVKSALKHRPKLAEQIRPSESKYSLELNQAKGEDQRWLKVEVTPLEEKSKVFYGQLVTIRDITEHKQLEKKLYVLSVTDELTGLYNRRYFIQMLNTEFDRAKRYGHTFSLIILDIDDFKKINDQQGHSAGDSVLRHLSDLITNRIRKVDTAARVGGEEFGIIVPDTDLQNTFVLAEDIRELVSGSPAFYEDSFINFTVSCGVTTFRSSTTAVEELLKAADKALYEAKNGGRNCTVKS